MLIHRNYCAAWAVCLSVIGCQGADEIRSYTVPKEAAQQAPLSTAAAGPTEPTDRMLTAILPDGERAWFLKVVGPLAEIDRHAEEITKFFQTVRVASEKPHPDWQLPEGWEQEAGSGMRAATIWIPTDSGRLEMSVIPLSWSGGQAALLDNVNRWRGQMQLAPTDRAGLAESTREVEVGDAVLTIVDLRGKMGSTGMTPPFAPFAPRAPRAGSSPSPSPSPSPISPLKFDTPSSWTSLPPSGFRKAVFQIASGTAAAEVTVTSFRTSSGPMITDLLANVNRWRNELGLTPIREEQLSEVTEAIEVDGIAGTFIDAIPDTTKPEESQADRGTLAAMVTRGETVWFFKMTGDRDLVAAERENLQSFLNSVRFTADGGAGHGD